MAFCHFDNYKLSNGRIPIVFHRIKNKMTEICRYRKSLCCEYASRCILFALFFTLLCNIFLFLYYFASF